MAKKNNEKTKREETLKEIETLAGEGEMAYQRLHTDYLDKVAKLYDSGDSTKKDKLIGALELFVENYARQSIPEGTVIYVTPSKTPRNFAFNFLRALHTRETAGLSRKKLSDELMIPSKKFIPYLWRVEKGLTTPRNPPKGKLVVPYIHWLKEQGYNPFKL